MTLEQAIFLVDELKPNQIERARKIEWLSLLDSRVFREIISGHQPDADTPRAFAPYTQETHPDTALLVPEPYAEMYRYYLEMHIDLVNLEYEKYNNSLTLFNSLWGQYARAYHRTHGQLSGARLKL